ncbi:MAG: cysteine desulfurase family protein [Candidatus Promineifilaceae bacterium]
MSERVYLDHAATTPVRPEVVEAMLPYWTEFYGNPSSVHRFGREASRGLLIARETFAELLNARSTEIVFTGCGSESDNLAVRGVMLSAKASGAGSHLITCAIEHKAVLETAKQLRDLHGIELTVLPVDRYGRIDPRDVEAAIRPDTVLISIMAANNEVGTLQPIQTIGELARQHGILFHTDAIQAAAVTAWDLQTMPIDLMSLAPHKFYGPKGIGVLYVREGIELVPSVTGGGQEEARRAGTENVAYAVGAAEAFRLAMSEREQTVAHYRSLSERLIGGIQAALPDTCILTGHPQERLPQSASFAFRHISGNDLLIHLDMAGIAASSGSACLTGDPKPSPVLSALGLGQEWTGGGLRLTVGRQNSMAHADYVLQVLPTMVRKLSRISQIFT